MPDQTRTVTPGSVEGSVRTEDGKELPVPEGWVLLPPGDAGWTRRVKAGGPTWTVKEKKGRRTFSRGVWAPQERVEETKRALDAERSSEAYAKRRQRDQVRRQEKQARAAKPPPPAAQRQPNKKRALHQNYRRLTHTMTGHGRGGMRMQARAKSNAHHANAMRTKTQLSCLVG